MPTSAGTPAAAMLEMACLRPECVRMLLSPCRQGCLFKNDFRTVPTTWHRTSLLTWGRFEPLREGNSQDFLFAGQVHFAPCLFWMPFLLHCSRNLSTVGSNGFHTAECRLKHWRYTRFPCRSKQSVVRSKAWLTRMHSAWVNHKIRKYFGYALSRTCCSHFCHMEPCNACALPSRSPLGMFLCRLQASWAVRRRRLWNAGLPGMLHLMSDKRAAECLSALPACQLDRFLGLKSLRL